MPGYSQSRAFLFLSDETKTRAKLSFLLKLLKTKIAEK